jgi:transcriptional regulator with XRE-family HTH domain
MNPVTPRTSEAVGSSLKTLRKLAGLTLDDVARLADTSTAYLSKVENGKFSPSRTYVAQVTAVIADAMKAAA